MHHHSNIEFYNKVVLCCFEYIVYNEMLIIFQVAFQRKLSKTSMKMPLSIFAPYKKLKRYLWHVNCISDFIERNWEGFKRKNHSSPPGMIGRDTLRTFIPYSCIVTPYKFHIHWTPQCRNGLINIWSFMTHQQSSFPLTVVQGSLHFSWQVSLPRPLWTLLSEACQWLRKLVSSSEHILSTEDRRMSKLVLTIKILKCESEKEVEQKNKSKWSYYSNPVPACFW